MNDYSGKQGRCPTVIDILLTIVLAITIIGTATAPHDRGLSFDGPQSGAMDPAMMTIII